MPKTIARTEGVSQNAGKSPTVQDELDWKFVHRVQRFLYLQAELLDGKRWTDYIDLFCDDGLYWMPPAPHYTTWEGQPSIFIEDRDLMAVRAKRLTHPRAWSQAAEWGTNHLVSNISIDEMNRQTGDVHVCSRFQAIEFRRDALRHFAGRYQHWLTWNGEGYQIKLQRVDLMNSLAAFDYVLLAWL